MESGCYIRLNTIMSGLDAVADRSPVDPEKLANHGLGAQQGEIGDLIVEVFRVVRSSICPGNVLSCHTVYRAADTYGRILEVHAYAVPV